MSAILIYEERKDFYIIKVVFRLILYSFMKELNYNALRYSGKTFKYILQNKG